MTLVANVTDVNDKIYDAARARRGAQRPSSRGEMTATLRRRHRRPRARPARPRAAGRARRSSAIVELIEALIDAGHAYAAGGRRLLPRRDLRRLRQAVEPAASRRCSQGEDDERRDAEGEPAGLRALEGAEGGRGHGLGRALGPRPAGLAHRVLGDGRAARSASTSTSTAAAPTWSSRTTRTRSPRPRRRAAQPLAAIWMHNGMVQHGRREDGEVGGQHLAARTRRSSEYGPRRADHVLRQGHYRQPLAFSRGRAASRPRRSVERVRELRGAGDPGTAPADGIEPYAERFFAALPTTSTRRARAPRCSTGSARPTAASTPASAGRRAPCVTCSGSSASTTCSTRRGATAARPRPSELLERARGGSRRARLRQPPTASATSWPRWAGSFATPPRPELVRRGRDPLRPQRRPRGASRPAQRVRRESAATAGRGRASAAGSRRARAARSPTAREELERLAARPTIRACAPRSSPTRTPTPAALLAAPTTRSSSRSTRSRTRSNLGAICRVAECAGATGVVIPERRSADVTPVVCKTSAGAVEHLPSPACATSRTACGRQGGGALGLRRRRRRRIPYHEPDYSGRRRARARMRRAAACARGWRPPATSSCAADARHGRIAQRVAPPRPRSCTESCIRGAEVDRAP